MAASSRVSNDLGLARTISWIADWYGQTTDLDISRVRINASPAVCNSTEHEKLRSKMRSRNESELHAFLKFAALSWLEVTSEHPETIAWEVLCYSPVPELCKGRTVIGAKGEELDIHSPQVLYDNPDNFPLSYGHAIRIDLHSFDLSVEVGGTTVFNLLTPLLDGMVDRAVWLPYPAGITTTNYRRDQPDLGTVDAYSIALC